MSFTSVETAHRMAAVEKKCTEGGDVMGVLTLREYFAAKAMALYFQGPDANVIAGHPDAIARWCYIMADSMLKARK
jgi:hypothetical protein